MLLDELFTLISCELNSGKHNSNSLQINFPLTVSCRLKFLLRARLRSNIGNERHRCTFEGVEPSLLIFLSYYRLAKTKI